MIVEEIENRKETLQTEFGHQYSLLFNSQPPESEISFYPYRNLSHTIRIRNGRALIRISDLLEDAPPAVLQAVIAILVHKLRKKPAPERWRRIYRHYVHRNEFLDQVRTVRRTRSRRKRLRPPQGDIFDLQELFNQLNARYFDDQIQVAHLGWSLRRSRRVLGHYDSTHRAIVINRRLDHPLVPEYVVCYVLFHEMLHALMGVDCHNGTRRIHHPRFKKAERRFPDFRRARNFIRTHLGRK